MSEWIIEARAAITAARGYCETMRGKLAARVCAINVLSQLKAACEGNLDRVARCVRLGGFVCSDETFTQQPEVLNGASDVILLAFGDAGRHARTAEQEDLQRPVVIMVATLHLHASQGVWKGGAWR